MGRCVQEKSQQHSPPTSIKSQLGQRPFASPEPEHESFGSEPRFDCSFGEMDLFPVQPKLVVGSPKDKYEQEADRVAERVMSMQKSVVPKIPRLDIAKKSEGNKSPVSVVSQVPRQGLLQRYIPAEELTGLDTAEQTAFMRQVYELQRQTSARKRAFVGDLTPAQIAEVESGVQARRDAAAACRMLLHAARDALREDQRRGDPLAMQVRRIGVASGYRSAQRQFQNWRTFFPRYYRQTQNERRRQPGGEHGAAAARLLARYIRGRLAAPGYSLHNSGIAIDFSTAQGRMNLGPNTSQIAQWNSSWFFNWLTNNAANFGFAQNPNIIEPWHWELVNTIDLVDFSEQEALISQAPESGNEGTEQGELIQPKLAGSKTCGLDSDFERLQTMKQCGKPLPESTRNLFEPRFGHDFSRVRVHTDAKANKLAGAINARAFTTGQEIFFRQGEFRPMTLGGQRLLAHELTHVVQQSGPASLKLKPCFENGATINRFGQEEENAAEHSDQELAKTTCALSLQAGQGMTIQRQESQTGTSGTNPVEPRRCGPDVTDWLINEMNRNMNHSVIRTMREVRWPRYIPGVNIGWTAGALYDFAQLVRGGGPWDFKSHQGARRAGWWRTTPGRDCPTENCDRTVTLCGTCVNYDVPGNIHFGWIGAAAGLRSWLLHFGAGIVQPNRWTDDPRDAAAIEIGENMWNSGTDLCNQVKARRNRLNLDGTEDCLSCGQR